MGGFDAEARRGRVTVARRIGTVCKWCGMCSLGGRVTDERLFVGNDHENAGTNPILGMGWRAAEEPADAGASRAGLADATIRLARNGRGASLIS